MYPFPRAIQIVVGIICGLVLLSTLPTLIASVALSPRPVWIMFGFEVVVALACVLGLMVARGKFNEGPALAVLCVAGPIFVGAILAYFGVGRALTLSGREEPISLTGWLLARVAAALLLAAMAAVLVLMRSRRCWNYAAKAAGAGAPLVLALGVAVMYRGPVASALGGLPGLVQIGLGGLAAVVGVVLFSAAAHYTIRAFEEGRLDAEAASSTTGAKST
jgi:hypothetical protein